MSENDVKSLLKSMKKLKAKKEVLKCLGKAEHEYDHLCRMIYALENSLESLNEIEREIIQMHLVDGYTWEQVMTQYEECHGKQNGYSKRTFERIQQKAIRSILEIIENSEFEELLSKYAYL